MRRMLWALPVCILLFALAACSAADDIAPTATRQELSVDIEFRDLYQSLGGEELLGPAISARRQNADGTFCQYTLNVKMCYNPNGRTETERHYLAPIGLNLKIVTPSPSTPVPLKVAEAFAETYRKISEVRPLGSPLTNAVYNPDKKRTEQYFDAMGFYIQADDPQKTVRLMPYGLAACPECSTTSVNDHFVGPAKNVDPTVIAQTGGYALFGNPLGAPFINEDGNLEQILDNVAIYTPADAPTTIRLRAIAVWLNQPRGVPGPERFGLKDNMLFVKVQGDLGYHVWLPFDEFIKNHNLSALAGRPLNDTTYATINSQKVPQQCYENFCLYYDANLPDTQKIKLVPLGQQYQQARIKK